VGVFEKIWFVASIAALGFFYGFASHAWNLFPKSQVELARQQLYFGYNHEGNDAYDPIYGREGVRIPRPDNVQAGLTLIESAWEDSTGWEVGLKLTDKRERTLHQWWPERALDDAN
jgi:hypothetical protein